MKKTLFIFIVVLLSSSVFLASCGGKSEDASLATADTLQVKELVGKFQAMLENSDIAAAAELLYYENDGKIEPISDSIKHGMIEAYSVFPIKECRMDYYKIKDYDDNSVKLRLVFATPNPAKPMETAILLKPTCVHNQWLLVLGLGEKDNQQTF